VGPSVPAFCTARGKRLHPLVPLFLCRVPVLRPRHQTLRISSSAAKLGPLSWGALKATPTSNPTFRLDCCWCGLGKGVIKNAPGDQRAVKGLLGLTNCYELNCAPQSSCVEVLPPSNSVREGGRDTTFKEGIKVK
jgi:hypothetical protein